MDSPGCSKISPSSSSEFDLPELPSVLPHPPQSENSPGSPKPKAERHERPTECSICGKKAHGYHYDVPSCNGCKTFFRRLCISEKNFNCKADRDCFDLAKRKVPIKCRACRYQKCIEVGMNPHAMQVDEKEATAGNFKKLTKQAKRANNSDEREEIEPEMQVVQRKQAIKMVHSMENKMQKMVDMLVYLESKVEKFRASSYNPDWKSWGGLDYFLNSPNQISVADKAGPMPGWPLKTEPGPPPMAPNFGKSRGPQYSPDRKQWLIFDLMTTVEYAKTFMFFYQLDHRDRFILLRYVTLAIMNLHISYFTVAKKYDTILHPDGKFAPMRKGMVYAETVMSIEPLIRSDVQATEYILLKAICLCNSAVPDLSTHAQEILSRERSLYAEALFDHCLRNRKDGPGQYAELLGMVELLERQQRIQKDLHLLHVAPFVSKIPEKDKMHLIEDIMNC